MPEFDTLHKAIRSGPQAYEAGNPVPRSVARFWWWQADRNDALWYLNVRIFRQPKEGDWASVIGQVRDTLAALPPNGNT